MRASWSFLCVAALVAVPSCGSKSTTSPPGPVYGSHWRKVADLTSFRRYEFGSAVFAGKMWVVGGWEAGGGIQSNCFSSANGIAWSTQAGGLGNAAEEFPVVAHDAGGGSELWAIASGQALHSADGYSWTLGADLIDSVGLRRGQTAVVFDADGAGANPAAIYAIAGSNGSTTYYADVWRSSNGTDWTRLTDAAAFGARWDGAAVVFDNRMWVIGGATAGYDPAGYRNDVWSSTDGITWTLVTDHAGFSPRMLHAAFAYGGRLWVVGGRATEDGVNVSYANDVWNSADGATWDRVTASADFGPRMGHACFVYDDGSGAKIWLVGGTDHAADSLASEVWRAE